MARTYQQPRSAASHDETEQLPRRSRALDLSGRAVLLATDGSPGAVAGAHVALALAKAHRAKVHVVSVVDTSSAPIPPPLDLMLALGDDLAGPGVHQEQIDQVRAALSTATSDSIDWPVRVVLGVPANAIVKEARRIGAVLIIVGLQRHGRIDRALNDEVTLNVMRHARCPVLAVIPGTTRLPTRMIAAMDFSHASVIAARAACAVMGADAKATLAFVAQDTGTPATPSESVIHELGVEAAFAQTLDDLGGAGVAMDHVVLHHVQQRSPADLILEHAESLSTDLISAGSARQGRIERWMLGSVSTDLVRDGSRSILIAPPVESVARGSSQ